MVLFATEVRKNKIKKKIPHCLNSSKIQLKNLRKRQNRYPQRTNLASVLALYSGSVEFDVKTSYSVNMALTDHANMTANITWIRILFALRLHYFDRFNESKQQAVTKYKNKMKTNTTLFEQFQNPIEKS
jgi:hypothetical protein